MSIKAIMSLNTPISLKSTMNRTSLGNSLATTKRVMTTPVSTTVMELHRNLVLKMKNARPEAIDVTETLDLMEMTVGGAIQNATVTVVTTSTRPIRIGVHLIGASNLRLAISDAVIHRGVIMLRNLSRRRSYHNIKQYYRTHFLSQQTLWIVFGIFTMNYKISSGRSPCCL